jgi:hypothetical protein
MQIGISGSNVDDFAHDSFTRPLVSFEDEKEVIFTDMHPFIYTNYAVVRGYFLSLKSSLQAVIS